ncbi:hypothetical protein BV25DRAFT_1874998 [Artomyces pyxidatus]|uniref:Uncharacterized protein n=1 Tax=Artomyces pyxidatus TaxID=48021 RepID=A0ACB8TLM7_9AGAM|nr:hypothetical protein BV25DRAFT_1874998 [Artomyces pyxidatus]
MSQPSDMRKFDEGLSSTSEEELELRSHRTRSFVENFAISFVTLNFMGSVRSSFFLGLLAGGARVVCTSLFVSVAFSSLTAFVMARIYYGLPFSGSVYTWLAATLTSKQARYFAFAVVCWSTSAWIIFITVTGQSAANHIQSQLAMWDIEFPGGISNDNITWRTTVWAMSEGLLLLSVAMNYLPTKAYSSVFKFSTALMILDFLLCAIWLPINAHHARHDGSRSAKEVFTMAYEGTGAPGPWNWMLSFLFSVLIFVGYNTPGYVAEDSKIASVAAGRGILTSMASTAVIGFTATFLFFLCTIYSDTISLNVPRTLSHIYALGLGNYPRVFMTVVAAASYIMTTTLIIVTGSRLAFSFALDVVLPPSEWIRKVTEDGQPRNAVTAVFGLSAALLCTLVPSQAVFTAILLFGTRATIAACGVSVLLRLTMTRVSSPSRHGSTSVDVEGGSPLSTSSGMESSFGLSARRPSKGENDERLTAPEDDSSKDL